MKKLTVSDLLRLACIYAERDQIGLLEAHEHCRDDPSYAELIADTEYLIKQLRDYRHKRWGKSHGDILDEQAKPVSIEKIARGPNRDFKAPF